MVKLSKTVSLALISGAVLAISTPAMAKIGVSKGGNCYYKNDAGNLTHKSCSDPDVTCRVMDPGIDDCKISGMDGPFYYSAPVAAGSDEFAVPDGPYKGKVIMEKEAATAVRPDSGGEDADTDGAPDTKETRYERTRPSRPAPRPQRRR